MSIVLALLLLVAMLSSCAFLSGLDQMTVEEAAARTDASVDGPADARTPSDTSLEADAADAAGDADTAPDGDAGDAASIRCGASSCVTPSECCNDTTNGKPSFTCVKAGSCTGSNHFVMRCDASSCPSNQVCCVDVDALYATSASCSGTCPSFGATVLCKSNAICALGKTCVAAPYGLTGYDACGL